MLIITIKSHHIKASNLSSLPNNKKYGEKNEREVCRQNLYPIAKPW
jgi:hypothetical protein